MSKTMSRRLSARASFKIESNDDDQQSVSTALSHLSQAPSTPHSPHSPLIVSNRNLSVPNRNPRHHSVPIFHYPDPAKPSNASPAPSHPRKPPLTASLSSEFPFETSSELINLPSHTTTTYPDYNQKIHCLSYHKDTVLCVAKCQFLNHNKQLVGYIFSGSQDSSIGVWNTDTFQMEGTLLGHSRSILNLYVINDSAFHPLLLSTSRDNCICIWDLKSLSLLFRITGLPSLVYDIEVLSFPHNGGYYLYGCCQDANVFALSLSILPYIMKLHYQKLKIEHQHKKQMAAFKKKSKLKKSKLKTHIDVSDGTDSFDLNVLNELLILNRPSILSPANFKQPWIDDEDIYREGGTTNDECKQNWSGSPSRIIGTSLGFKLPRNTNDIKQLISTDATVQFLSQSIDDITDIYYELIYDEEADTEQEESFVIHRKFGGCHHGFIFVMKQLEHKYKLITGASDGTTKIWHVDAENINKLQLLSVLTGHTHSVIDFDIWGAGEYLVTASRDETLKIWNIENVHKPHTRYTMNGGDGSELTAVKVIGNDWTTIKLIVSASRNGLVKFWNGKTYECLKTVQLNQEKVARNTELEGLDNNYIVSPNSLHKEWTCDAEKLEQTKPICVMQFEFMEPSWLLLCDTAYTVQIWDISQIFRSNNRFVSSSQTASLSMPIDMDMEEKNDSNHSMESVLNTLGLAEYSNNFQVEKVDYSTLSCLCEADLIELGLPLGPRKKIIQFVNRKKTNNNNRPHGSYNMIADLARFVSYKSISCKIKYQSECWNATYFIQNKCEQFGAETRLVQGRVGKNPVVLAKFTNKIVTKNKNKVIRIVMYGHYDVVDTPNNNAGWLTDPFELTGKNGYLYGRGTTDNKGPIIVFLYAIRELLLEEDGTDDISVEIILVIEGQEEHEWNEGGLKQVICKNMDWLQSPAVIVCSNSYWIGEEVPCLVYGMRGHLQINVAVNGSSQDCHSGIHGGVFSEPTFDLISVLSKLKNDKNKVLIPGFYDNILPIEKKEIALYDEIISTFNTADYLKQIGYKLNINGNNKMGLDSKLLLISKWRNPCLSIHNIQQSSTECTVISKNASAIISIRSVPKQNNIAIIEKCEKYLLSEFEKLSTFNSIHVSHNNIGGHWLMDYENYIFQCAEKAIVEHWGIKPYYIREGGTIPCTNYLYQKLNAPILQFPLGQSTDRAHLENERIRLQNISKGKDVIKSFLINLIQYHQKRKSKGKVVTKLFSLISPIQE